MSNSRIPACGNKNPRMSHCSNCMEPRVTYHHPGCNCYPKVEHAKDMVLAMGYVPWQNLNSVFEPDKALQMGTLFPELLKPYTGCKGGHC